MSDTYEVTFEAHLSGVECDAPEDDAALAQAVQDVIGHTGAIVQEIVYYDTETDDD